MARIGFIGLGNMGLPMAQNLLKAGHAVAGFDLNVDGKRAIDGERRHPVELRWRTACKDAEVVITMLPAGEHVRDVYLGDAGVLAAVAPGTLLIDSSTIDVETTRGGGARPPRAGDFPWSTRPCPAAWPAPRRRR
jgi:3-hydroxyisobutyrate dehydrogenase